jgi:hypothetical protein
MVMKDHMVYRILVHDDSPMNILSAEAMKKIGVNASRMTLVPTTLVGRGVHGSVRFGF